MKAKAEELNQSIQLKDFKISELEKQLREALAWKGKCSGLEQQLKESYSLRDKTVAEYKVTILTLQEKSKSDLVALREQMELLVLVARTAANAKQQQIDLLTCRLEELEHTRTTDAQLVEEIHRRYKVQIEILNREYEDQTKRYNLYILEL